jgi:hypothetical protein
MQHIIDLGHGLDDRPGKNFVESMQELVEIGVVRGKKHVRCSIFEATVFDDPAYGASEAILSGYPPGVSLGAIIANFLAHHRTTTLDTDVTRIEFKYQP